MATGRGWSFLQKSYLKRAWTSRPINRNGTSEKTVLTDDGLLTLDVPRDRESSFEPRLERALGGELTHYLGYTTAS